MFLPYIYEITTGNGVQGPPQTSVMYSYHPICRISRLHGGARAHGKELLLAAPSKNGHATGARGRHLRLPQRCTGKSTTNSGSSRKSGTQTQSSSVEYGIDHYEKRFRVEVHTTRGFQGYPGWRGDTDLGVDPGRSERPGQQSLRTEGVP